MKHSLVHSANLIPDPGRATASSSTPISQRPEKSIPRFAEPRSFQTRLDDFGDFRRRKNLLSASILGSTRSRSTRRIDVGVLGMRLFQRTRREAPLRQPCGNLACALTTAYTGRQEVWGSIDGLIFPPDRGQRAARPIFTGLRRVARARASIRGSVRRGRSTEGMAI